jgi:hypothetical protein
VSPASGVRGWIPRKVGTSRRLVTVSTPFDETTRNRPTSKPVTILAFEGWNDADPLPQPQQVLHRE